VYNVVASEASCDSESSYGAKAPSTVKVLLLQAGTIANDDDEPRATPLPGTLTSSPPLPNTVPRACHAVEVEPLDCDPDLHTVLERGHWPQPLLYMSASTSITNCLRKCLIDNLKLVSHATTSHFFCTGDICPALRCCRSILQVTVAPVLCCRHFCVKAIVLGFYVEVTDATHCSIYLGDSII
jgi:hypothetical protein